MTAPGSALEIIAQPSLWASPDLPFLPLPDAAAKLAAYMDLLLDWNRKLNLTGYAEPRGLLADLIQDSFFLARFLEDVVPDYQDRLKLEICDLGAGAGLPGIPLRIIWPFGRYTWVERRSKRALFLQNAGARLHLNWQGQTASAETVLNSGPRRDCILSRAFMPWPDLLKLCANALTEDGSLVVMANEAPPELPPGWLLARSLAYRLPARQRWLWALRRER